jgi:hypothetical protein
MEKDLFVVGCPYNFFLLASIDADLQGLTTTFHSFYLHLQINTTYLHIDNYFFSLGDDVITAYISGIQFLPVCSFFSL